MRCVLFLLAAVLARAAGYPAPVEGDWVVRDFRFHSGETLPELRLHYITVGAQTGIPVVLLHGTTGSSGSFLTDTLAGELFGAGQPLDAATHYIVIPDALGAGKSAKPSDGMRARFPQYDYDDVVRAQYRLLNEHLGIAHVRLLLGVSAGGMQAWMWGEMYPGFMDALMPMASQPGEVAGRNWMMRRMVIDAIRNDPDWHGGNYDKQPGRFQTAQVFYNIATSGGAAAIHKTAPTREKADADLNRRLAQASAADANDVLYQMEASRHYNPAPDLARIQARVLALNSADDERNPPELGTMERAMKQIANARYVLVPQSEESRGHGTTQVARLWKQYLAELLANDGHW